MIQINNSYIKYLFFLLPLSLVTGPLIPEIIVFFVIINFFFDSFKRNVSYVFKNNFFKLFIIISLFIIVRNYFSDYFFKNYLNSLFYFRFTIFSLAIYLIDLQNRNFKKIVFYGILSAYILLFMDTLIEYFFHDRIYGLKSIYDSRISSFFGDEYVMGSFAVRFLPIAIFTLFWLDIKKSNYYLILFSILLVTGILVILSGERAALLLFFLVCIILVLLKKFRTFFSIHLIIFLTVFLYFLQNNNYNERYFGFLKNNNFKNNEFIFFTQEHHSLMLTSFKIIKSNFLLGTGGKSFSFLCGKDEFKTITYPNNDIGKEDIGCSTHPHNVFLQVFLEYGILGIIIYLTILTQVIFKFFFNILEYNKRELPIYKNKNLSLVFLYLSLLMNIFPFIPSGSLFNNWFSIILYMPIGFILSLEKK